MTMSDDRILTWLAVVAGVAFITLGMVSSCGCTLDVQHNFDDIEISINGECLSCVPMCAHGLRDPYKCVQGDTSAPCPGCHVACVGARTMTCEPDGIHCLQRVGDDELEVPVICVHNEEP